MTAETAPPGYASVSQIARLLMVTPERVRQLAREGVIPRLGRDQYHLVGAVQGYLRWLQDDARSAIKIVSATRVADAREKLIKNRVAERLKTLIPADDFIATLELVQRVVLDEMDLVQERLPTSVRTPAKAELAASKLRIESRSRDAIKAARSGANFD